MSDPSDPIHSFLEAVGLTVDESRKLGDLLKTHVGRFSPSEKDAARLRDLLENPGREEEGTVLGRYLDLGVLGLGDMAEVRRVSDVVLKRTLAMRIIHAKKLDDPEAVRWFIEEARVGAQLQHPGIVPIYEIGQLPDGRHYYTMNEVQGTEFTLSIAAIHRASPEELGEHSPTDTRLLHLVQILHRVCVTVAYAHARGVFHGDLTPGNIRVGEFGEVLVVNWGSVAGTSRGPSSDPGTTDGGHTGIGKDILGLGAILHQVLHGFPPPENPATTGPARAQGGSPALPPRLASICIQALSQEPGRRQAQARDLAHQLQTWLEGAAAGDHPAARTPEPSSTADEEDTPRERELAIPRADEQVEKGALAGEQPQDEEARTEPKTPLDGTESEDSKLALIEANRLFELGTLEREQANFDEARQCQKKPWNSIGDTGIEVVKAPHWLPSVTSPWNRAGPHRPSRDTGEPSPSTVSWETGAARRVCWGVFPVHSWPMATWTTPWR